jgi:hypothetical protein
MDHLVIHTPRVRSMQYIFLSPPPPADSHNYNPVSDNIFQFLLSRVTTPVATAVASLCTPYTLFSVLTVK